jgi:hypothetical protein
MFDMQPGWIDRSSLNRPLMSDRAWLFKCVSCSGSGSTAQLWRWHARSGDRGTYSSLLFGTLAECVHDAQRHGFRGEVDPADGSFTPGGYEINVAEDAIGPSTPV